MGLWFPKEKGRLHVFFLWPSGETPKNGRGGRPRF
jgi:hypothetical protein